jgi:hypothetical protein
MSWIASHASTLAFVFSALALVLVGFLFTLFINPRIKDVDDLKIFAGKLVAWKIPENIDKLSALEIMMSNEAGRNLSQRADSLETVTGDLSQRLSKLEGAEAERNRRLEEVTCSRKTQPVEAGAASVLTRPGKLARRRLEISACVVRLVPVCRAQLRVM